MAPWTEIFLPFHSPLLILCPSTSADLPFVCLPLQTLVILTVYFYWTNALNLVVSEKWETQLSFMHYHCGTYTTLMDYVGAPEGRADVQQSTR